MQKLEFEQAWDKTLAEKDRQHIKHVFDLTLSHDSDRVKLVYLWHAINHKSERLITSLIHNYSDKTFTFQEQKLRYVKNNQVVAEYTFTIPALSIEPETSIPWTFIFPKGSYDEDIAFEDGYFILVD